MDLRQKKIPISIKDQISIMADECWDGIEIMVRMHLSHELWTGLDTDKGFNHVVLRHREIENVAYKHTNEKNGY